MKLIANCAECGTHLVGENLNRIGDRFYCQSDYNRVMERDRNMLMERDNTKLSKLVTPFENMLSLDFENDWSLTNVSASGNSITCLVIGGTLLYETEMKFGKRYLLKSRLGSTIKHTIMNYSGVIFTSNKVLYSGTPFIAINKYIRLQFLETGTFKIEELTLVEV